MFTKAKYKLDITLDHNRSPASDILCLIVIKLQKKCFSFTLVTKHWPSLFRLNTFRVGNMTCILKKKDLMKKPEHANDYDCKHVNMN